MGFFSFKKKKKIRDHFFFAFACLTFNIFADKNENEKK